jgi:hypothetical protein
MADKRISQLVERTDIANNDVVPIVASGATTTNKATISSIQEFMQENLDLGVTSVGITLGTTGTDVSVTGSPITTSGNITINIPSASATARGLVTTGTQTFAGAKTFSSDLNINEVNVGRGGGNLTNNTRVGLAALNANTTGQQNTALGTQSLLLSTTGSFNTGLGYNALLTNTVGAANTAVGSQALVLNTTGTSNTSIGNGAGRNNTTGDNNSFLGSLSGADNTTGSSNVAVGLTALSRNITGGQNTAIGRDAGRWIADGVTNNTNTNSSIYIGFFSKANADNQTNQIVIGHNATGQGSNTVTIGNSDITSNKLFGRVIHADAVNADESATLGQVSTSLGGYVTLGTAQTITAQKTFSTSGSSDTMIISHGSGSGFALDISKGGNGEAIRVTKTSGSGNAMTVIGGNFEAPTIVKTGGTSSQFLKANGSVDSNTYLTTASASAAYVPYTGANANLDLGQFDLFADTILVNGPSPTSGSYLGFKHATTVISGAEGYTSLYTFGTNTIAFKSVSGATTKDFSFDMSSITANVSGGRVYTLPDASGTIALTSNLGAYLPLTGGTLTGALNGTSASFTGDLTASSNAFFGTFNGNNKYHFEPFTNAAGGANNAYLVSGKTDNNERSGFIFQARNSNGDEYNALIVEGYNSTSTTPALRIASTGAATFSSSVTAGGNIGNSQVTLSNAFPNITFATNGNIVTTGANPIAFRPNDVEAMRITSAGNVGIGTASPGANLHLKGSSGSAIFRIEDSSGVAVGRLQANAGDGNLNLFEESGYALTFGTSNIERMRIRFDGLVFINGLISSFTTGSAANMFVSAGDGAIYRSTSSIKYKKNVEDYDKGLTEVMQMRPVFYEGISESDEGKIFAGLIAEEVHDLGLTEFVQYAEDGSPDSLAYQNMVALLIKAIQELKIEIDSLKNQIK